MKYARFCVFSIPFIVLDLILFFPLASPLVGQETDDAATRFFETRVRPVFVERCFDCHSGEAAESGLRLDSRAAILKGGVRGPSIVVGKPKESLLIRALGHGEELQMPPKEKLSVRQIADIAAWIGQGAPWPGLQPDADSPSNASSNAGNKQEKNGKNANKENEKNDGFSQENASFWAFRPPKKPDTPPISSANWGRTPIDAFILAELERRGLRPAPPADKRTLLRRATFDLIGLPPTADETAAFLADTSPNAFEKVVDRLLNSPHYGERWGRRWLDVARYADSNGLDENLAFANAFRYRDYVVRSFNFDKPYDVFLQEQIAGDLLPDSGDPQTQIDRRIATGFLSLGAKMLAEDDPVKMQMDLIDEQVDTLGRAIMGLTLGCARCHDHKFDPIPTSDYYALAGVFKSTKTMDNFNVVARWQEVPLATPEAIEHQKQLQQQIAAVESQIDRMKNDSAEALLHEARLHVGDYLLAALAETKLQDRLKQAKPRGDTASAQISEGVRIIEAEDYHRGNVLKDRTNYGKSIGVLVNQGQTPNFVEYDVAFDASQAGLKQLELRYAAASARPCRLYINGELVKDNAAGNVTGGWYPDKQVWAVEGFFRFTAGENIIRLEHPQFFPHIDKLLIGPAPSDVDLGSSSPVSLEPLSPDYQPLPELVNQWRVFLERTKNKTVARSVSKDKTEARSVSKDKTVARSVSKDETVARSVSKDKRDDPGSVTEQKDNDISLAALFDPWREFIETAQFSLDERQRKGPLGSLLKDPPPKTLRDLARRYQQRFAEVEIARRKTPDSTRPQDEPFQRVLTDPKGPFANFESIENRFPPETIAQLDPLRDKKKLLESNLPTFPTAMAVSEATPQDLRIHIRGSHLTLGEMTPRGFPKILTHGNEPSINEKASGRLELAKWLTTDRHPLTARVIVNRLWIGHFGRGIVRSPDNFGRLGERPTHPKLLDYLTTRLTESGWSIKAMQRLMMLSSTYQMSAAYNARAASLDPENKLLWRMNRRRLEAEAIRDSLLAVSGRLDRSLGGSLLPTPNRQYVTSTANVDPIVYDTRRRSIYLPVVRSALYDVFQAFDFPDPSVLAGKRESTTVAPQALFMMNSEFVSRQTQAMAEQLLSDSTLSDAQRLQLAYETAYARPPTKSEQTAALEYVKRYEHALESLTPNATERRKRAWQSLLRAIVSANEFVYVE